jgi:WD40 repeat protein
VPHADPGERLIGRDGILHELDRTLSSGNTPTVLTALQGTGGIGKTQLAARYCWTRRDRYPGGILWLNIADPARAVNELVGWAEQLHLEVTDPSDRAKANAVIGRVRGRPDALVVLDNLEDQRVLDLDLPGLVNSRLRGLGCKLLITSRDQVPGCRPIRLDFLPAPIDSVLLLREAMRESPPGEEAGALRDLLTLLGGLPLALVMTGRLLADRPHLTFARFRTVLRSRGAVSVLSESGQIPEDYHEKIGSSFRAVLSEVWDSLPGEEFDLRRKILTALALFGENVFVSECVLPLMLELPEPNSNDLDPPPLERALALLSSAQLLERNQERAQLRLHPLIQDFVRRRQEQGDIARMLEHVAEAASPILDLPVDHLSDVTSALEILSKLESGSGIADLCRLLRVESDALRHPVQFAFAAGVHGRVALKAAAEEVADAAGRPYLRLRWTTGQAPRSLRHRLRGHDDEVKSCAIKADGSAALSASSDGCLIVWDLATGRPRHILYADLAGAGCCAISADGRAGLSALEDHSLIVWDLQSGQQRYRLRGHTSEVAACAVSAEGHTGLSVSEGQTLIVWDLLTGSERYRRHGHTNGISSCGISADGSTGLSASEDQTLIVWDITAGRRRFRLRGHQYAVRSCAISADGRIGLSGSEDETLIVWDLITGEPVYRLSDRKGGRGVRHCAISADGGVGLSISSDSEGQTLVVWDLTAGREKHRLEGHTSEVSGCAISADGSAGLTVSYDGTLVVWDLEAEDLRSDLGAISGCAVSFDESVGLSGSDDGTLIVWDLTTGGERSRLRGHEGPVCNCAISADGRIGLSASNNEPVIVWDLAAGRQRHCLLGHEGLVRGCAISAEGCIGLSGSDDQTLIVWDLVTGQQRHRLRGHQDTIEGCGLSAAGTTGLSASYDGTLIVWDLVSGEKRHCLRGHTGAVTCCAVSADGCVGFSASDDNSLIVWDLVSGKERLCWTWDYDEPIESFAIAASGRSGLSASGDRKLTVWDLTTGRAISPDLTLDSAVVCVALGSTGVALIGDRKGNITCLELVIP